MSRARLIGAVFVLVLGTAGEAIAAATTPSGPDASSITAQRVGELSLVDADRRGVALASGGGSTEFSLALPSEATCPGDSRNDNWRVQTFIVPEGVDPATVEYGPNGPTGRLQWAFHDTFTSPVIEGLLKPNEAPGSPGRIDSFPPMSFEVFPVGEIPPGTYRAGAACTWFGATGPYWDTEMVFSAAPADQPAGLRWTVPGVPDPGPNDPGSSSSPPWNLIFVLIALLAFGYAFFLGRRPGHPKRSLR